MTVVSFFLNPHLLVCFLIAWMFTNGWAYIFATVGLYLDMPVLSTISLTYLGIIWLPFTPEKIVTFFVADLLLKRFYPEDTDAIAVLKHLLKEK